MTLVLVPAPPSHGRKERRDELARIQTRILEGTRAAAAVAVAEEQDMTRQLKHKHRVTRLMLSVRVVSRYQQEIADVWQHAYREISAAMAQAYGKARAEQESKT
jgi:hypothetical protein